SVRRAWWSRSSTCCGPAPIPPTARPGRRWPGTCAGAPDTKRSSRPSTSRPSAWPPPDRPPRNRTPPDRPPRNRTPHDPIGCLMTTLVIEGAAIATVDSAGTEYASGHLVAKDGWITAVGPGPAPSVPEGARVVDGAGCLLTPGLVNTHHHLYQWATRGYAIDATLFEWLTELYPVWARLTAPAVGAAATAGLAWLARSGCTPTTDHHYLFPRTGGDVLGSTVEAAAQVGLRFHPTRGSMDLGQSQGGLPPDEVVESIDDILAASAEAVTRFHDPAPGAMVRVALAPCSPFSV